jgi:hypothetical protein
MNVSLLRSSLCAPVFVFACVGDDSVVKDAGPDVTQQQDTSTDVAADTAPQDVATEAGFNPNLYGNLELWVAADVGLAPQAGKMTWTDQSPKARLVQSPNDTLPCSNPSIMSSAINGLPAAKFNGSNNCFTMSQAWNDFTNGISMFVVAQPQNNNSPFEGADSAFIDLGNGGPSAPKDNLTFGRAFSPTNTATGDYQLLIYNGTSGPSTSLAAGSGTTYVNGITHLFEVIVPATAPAQTVAGAKLFEDGTSVGATTSNLVGPDNTTRAKDFIGYNLSESTNTYQGYAGLIGEIIVFSRALTDPQRTAVEAHLKTKWGL